MGVRGLSSLVKAKLRGEPLSFDLRADNAAERSVVIDYYAFHHFILGKCIRARIGYVREFLFLAMQWLEIFLKAKWRMTFVVDGCVLGHRNAVRWSKVVEQQRLFDQMFGALRNQNFILSSEVNKGVNFGFSHALTWLLRSFGIELVVAVGEADELAAWYAAKYGALLVSLDSDYYVQTLEADSGSQNAASYVPLDSLAVSYDGNYLTCRQFFSRVVSCVFNLPKYLLPLLAVLVGNDFTSAQSSNVLVAAPIAVGHDANHLTCLLKVPLYRRNGAFFQSVARNLKRLASANVYSDVCDNSDVVVSRVCVALAEHLYGIENVAHQEDRKRLQKECAAYLAEGLSRYSLPSDASGLCYPSLDRNGSLGWIVYLLNSHHLSSSLFGANDKGEKELCYPLILDDVDSLSGYMLASFRVTQLAFNHVVKIYGAIERPSCGAISSVFSWDYKTFPYVLVSSRFGKKVLQHRLLLSYDSIPGNVQLYIRYFTKVWRPDFVGGALESSVADLLNLLEADHYLPFIRGFAFPKHKNVGFQTLARIPQQWVVACLAVRELLRESEFGTDVRVSKPVVDALLISIIFSGLASRWPNTRSPTKMKSRAIHYFAKFQCLCYSINLLFGVALLTDDAKWTSQDWAAVDAMAFYHSLDSLAQGYHPFELLGNDDAKSNRAVDFTPADIFTPLEDEFAAGRLAVDSVELLRLVTFLVLYDLPACCIPSLDDYTNATSLYASLSFQKQPKKSESPFKGKFRDCFGLTLDYSRDWVGFYRERYAS